MTGSVYKSNVDRIMRAIADLRKKAAEQATKEADLHSKLNRAVDGARRATSTSSANSKLREVERFQSDLARLSGERARTATALADKTRDLQRNQDQLSSQEAREQKIRDEKIKKEQTQRAKQLRDFDTRLKAQKKILEQLPLANIELGHKLINGISIWHEV